MTKYLTPFINLLVYFGLLATSLSAATFDIDDGDVTALSDAILTSNANRQDDIINLAENGTYILDSVNNTEPYGNNGLPPLTFDNGHKLIINGNGSIIKRSSDPGVPEFRIFMLRDDADVTMNEVILFNGRAASGGAIFNRGGTLRINYSAVAGNSVHVDYAAGFRHGGGIRNGLSIQNPGRLYLSHSSIYSNEASDAGGGVFNGFLSSTVLENCTFFDNHARGGGGFFSYGTAHINNSTFSGNTDGKNHPTRSREGGGALMTVGSGAAVYISNSTFAGNSSGKDTGDIHLAGTGTAGLVEIGNTLLSKGPSGATLQRERGGTFISRGYNLSDDGGTDAFSHATDRNNTNLHLDPDGLKHNGGFTSTIALMPDSPAIDQGKRDTLASSPFSVITDQDQRGFARPYNHPSISNAPGGDGSDIGAFEEIPPLGIKDITATPAILWPPNRQMVPITIDVTATDNSNFNSASKVIAVTSNQPVTGPNGDWEITGDLTLNLRAQRSGGGARIYTITVESIDALGNVSTDTVIVTVPKQRVRGMDHHRSNQRGREGHGKDLRSGILRR